MTPKHLIVGSLLTTLLACGDGTLDYAEDSRIDSDDPNASSGIAGCNEGNCQCFVTLAQVMNREPHNPSWLQGNLGGTPENVFSRGGSENIPVTCRTAKYWLDDDPEWLDRYFEIQLEPGAPYMFGGELFAGLYHTLNAGTAIATLKHARDAGHTQLADKAAAYLRTYWASLALAAVNRRLTRKEAYNVHADPLVETTSQNGYNTGIVGARTYVNGHGGSGAGVTGNGFHFVLLSMALEHPNREAKGNLTYSPGAYGGVRAAIEAVGYRLDNNGKVNLRSRSISPEMFGLSAEQRSNLASFIQSHGRQKWQETFSLLATSELVCPITIVRTTGGVISWFGTSETEGVPCNGRKGGSWAIARMTTEGVATFVTRSSDKWGGGDRGVTWRDGDRICSESSTLPMRCLDVPQGEFVHEVLVDRTAGVECIAGNCGPGGGTDPAPDPAPDPDPDPDPDPHPGPDPDPGTSAHGAHSMARGNYLGPNESLVSDDGRFRLVYQSDGNLVLYSLPSSPLWSTATHGTNPGVAVMQDDGNFVVYDAQGVPRWASGTHPYGDTLVLQNDGNLVLFDGWNRAVWSTGTEQHSNASLADFPITWSYLPAGATLETERTMRALINETGKTFSFEFSDTGGRFQQRPGGPCSPHLVNPGRIEMTVAASRGNLASCRFKSSHDVGWIPCSSAQVEALNTTGITFQWNTDTTLLNADCTQGVPWHAAGAWESFSIEFTDTLGESVTKSVSAYKL